MAIYKSIEQVNPDVCNKLVNMTFSQFLDFLKIVDGDKYDKEGEDIWNINQYKMIVKYCKYLKANNYKVKQEYNYSSGNNEGRIFVKNMGLQRINRYFRGILSNGLYTDIDMKNAHPNLLMYIYKKEKINCPKLIEFCNNRENKYTNLMNSLNISRGECKMLYLKSMNSKEELKTLLVNGKKKTIKDEAFLEFDKEMKRTQKEILSKNGKLKTELINKGKLYNIEGKLQNYLLCRLENDILNQARQLNIIKMDVPIFDGFMTSNNIDNNIISQLNKLTKKYNIEWDVKEHDTTLMPYIMDLKPNEKMFFIGDNVIDLSKKILDEYLDDKLFICQGQYWFKSDILYLTDEKLIKRELFKWITNNDLYTVFIKDNIDIYLSANDNIKKIDDLIKSLLNLSYNNEDFHIDLWEDTLKKIYFNNGFYDFKKQEFITDKTMFKTTNMISYNLNMKSNNNIRNEIMNKVFKPVFGLEDDLKDKTRKELMDYFLQRLSRMIAGHIEDKKWIVMCGLRNCGKGVISDLLKKTFQCYIKTTNSDNFMYKKSQGDSAKNNSWIVDYIYTRIAITQEISLDEKEYIDGSKIKKFCSGGDYMSGRTNFKDEMEFRIQSSLLVCCNDIPSIKPMDCYETCDEMMLYSKFINKDELNEKSKLDNIKYYSKDENIKNTFLSNPEVWNEFVLILIDYYNMENLKYPEEIKKCNEEDNEETNDDIIKLKSLFKQGDLEIDITYNDEIRKILVENHIQISMKLFNKRIKGCFNVMNYKLHSKRGFKGLLINKED